MADRLRISELDFDTIKSNLKTFLNVHEAQRIQNRPMFDELMKVFAKRHYGWDVNKVWFHFY